MFINPSTLSGLTSDGNPKTVAAGENSVSFTLSTPAGTPSSALIKFTASGSGVAALSKTLPVTVVLSA